MSLLQHALCVSALLSSVANADRLIGGEVAQEGQTHMPGIVRIWGTCTAAKVGPRHFLTAAHCFVDGENGTPSPLQTPGATVYLSNSVQPGQDGSNWVTTAVEKVHLEPGYLSRWSACTDAPCRYGIAYQESDVAVLVVRDFTPTIATATIDYSYISPELPVTLTGYGCEDDVATASTTTGTFDGRLKYKFVATQFATALSHDGFSWLWTSSVFAKNIITPGLKWSDDAASLCPGDSGGPLYNTNTSAVVGVNSYYSFLPEEPARVSQTNWHTRLSVVAGWIRQSLTQ